MEFYVLDDKMLNVAAIHQYSMNTFHALIIIKSDVIFCNLVLCMTTVPSVFVA